MNILLNSNRYERRTFNGFYIYASDGFETEIPRSDDILKQGFAGRRVGKYRQTHYPRLYMVHTYDVLSRTTKALYWDHKIDEMTGAQANIASLERNSITLYDRYYISKRMMRAHIKAKNYFIMRCKTEGGLNEILEFAQSKAWRGKIQIDNTIIHLVKVTNPRTQEAFVLATNLPEDWIDKVILKRLYSLRWEVENSFRDLTESLKIESWHSKDFNGVMQELYAKFWLMNYARIQILINSEMEENPLQQEYKRCNFKLILDWIVSHIKEIFHRYRKLRSEIKTLIKLSTERRKRFRRSYPRQIKYSRKRYDLASVIWDWDVMIP